MPGRDGIRLSVSAIGIMVSIVAMLVTGSFAYGSVVRDVTTQKERIDKIDETLAQLRKSDGRINSRLTAIEVNLALLMKAQGLTYQRQSYSDD